MKNEIGLVPTHYNELNKRGIMRLQDPRTWDMNVDFKVEGKVVQRILPGWKVRKGNERFTIDKEKIPKLPDVSPGRMKMIPTELSDPASLGDNILERSDSTDVEKQRYIRSISGFHPLE